MRVWLAFAVGLGAFAAGAGERYGVAPDLKTYPQATPKEALASALKAAEAGRFDYLAAQLADPAWVDERIKRLYGGRFEDQVEEARARLDPPTLKLLRRFLAEYVYPGFKGRTDPVKRAEAQGIARRFAKKLTEAYAKQRIEALATDFAAVRDAAWFECMSCSKRFKRQRTSSEVMPACDV